jgi:3-phenylpropionate/trans-cinnamate dioxygenase ferredoxin reductase subunit
MLRTLEDAVELDYRLHGARNLAVIGGGFIGLEVAAAARTRGLAVTVLEALERTMARLVSPVISEHVCDVHRKRGTDVRHQVRAVRIVDDGHGNVAGVELDDGHLVEADVVLIAVGAIPNTELADTAGLDCANGIVVDEYLRTSDPAICATGDCAAFPWEGGTSRRLESVQNATAHGRTAAATITGNPRPHNATPWFWTYQHDCKVQIAGLTTGHDATVVRGQPRAGSFSVFCYAGNRLLGVESVNRPKDHFASRKLLDAQAPLPPAYAADESFDLQGYVARVHPNPTPSRSMLGTSGALAVVV